MIEKTVKRIEWLLTKSGLTTYSIAKELGMSTQFLDRYKNDISIITKMSIEKASKLEKYALTKRYILSPEEILAMASAEGNNNDHEISEVWFASDGYIVSYSFGEIPNYDRKYKIYRIAYIYNGEIYYTNF